MSRYHVLSWYPVMSRYHVPLWYPVMSRYYVLSWYPVLSRYHVPLWYPVLSRYHVLSWYPISSWHPRLALISRLVIIPSYYIQFSHGTPSHHCKTATRFVMTPRLAKIPRLVTLPGLIPAPRLFTVPFTSRHGTTALHVVLSAEMATPIPVVSHSRQHIGDRWPHTPLGLLWITGHPNKGPSSTRHTNDDKSAVFCGYTADVVGSLLRPSTPDGELNYPGSRQQHVVFVRSRRRARRRSGVGDHGGVR